MWSSILLVVMTCKALAGADSSDSDTANADVFETDMFGAAYTGFYQKYRLDNLVRRLQALENNVKSGAVGGCESGVIGPFSPAQSSGTIRFRTRFSTPPAVALAVSDLRVANANNGSANLNFQIRPSAVSTSSAAVTFKDMTNNLASAYVSYMACPSNSNQAEKV